jgi:hypothetical protein
MKNVLNNKPGAQSVPGISEDLISKLMWIGGVRVGPLRQAENDAINEAFAFEGFTMDDEECADKWACCLLATGPPAGILTTPAGGYCQFWGFQEERIPITVHDTRLS